MANEMTQLDRIENCLNMIAHNIQTPTPFKFNGKDGIIYNGKSYIALVEPMGRRYEDSFPSNPTASAVTPDGRPVGPVTTASAGCDARGRHRWSAPDIRGGQVCCDCGLESPCLPTPRKVSLLRVLEAAETKRMPKDYLVIRVNNAKLNGKHVRVDLMNMMIALLRESGDIEVEI